MHVARFAEAWVRDKDGSSSAARIPMMAMTTSSSINVSPEIFCRLCFTVSLTRLSFARYGQCCERTSKNKRGGAVRGNSLTTAPRWRNGID